METEIWKDIPHYSGFYQASNLGRIRSVTREVKFGTQKRTIPSKVLIQSLDSDGRYLCVGLSVRGKVKGERVHRLIASTFIPNPENKPEVNHKKGIKTDNRETELEWSTHSENEIHAHKHGLKVAPWKGKFGRDNVKSKPVIQCDLNGIPIKEWANASEIQRELGFSRTNINAVCQGMYKGRMYGYMWKRANASSAPIPSDPE